MGLHCQKKLKEIKKSLKPGGMIHLEHHITAGQETTRGPSSSEHRFNPNELLKIFSDFQILYYKEGIEEYDDGKRSAIVRLIARKTDHPQENLPVTYKKIKGN